MAGISQSRTGTGVNRISAFVNRCDNFDCFSTTTVASVFLATTWDFNQNHVLRMTWEPAHDQFRFVVISPGPVTAEEIISYAGLFSDTTPPQDSDFKRIIITNGAENCTAGPPKVSMEVFIDNVRLNAEAIPAPALSGEGHAVTDSPQP